MQYMVKIIPYPISDERAKNQGNAHAREAGDIDKFFFRVFFLSMRKRPTSEKLFVNYFVAAS